MNEIEATTEPQVDRSPVMALAQWVVLVALAFGVTMMAMRFLAGSVSIPSPIRSAVAEPAAGSEAGSATTLATADFRLPTLDGRELGPPDFPGEVVLVEFWATWCGPCKLQARFLEELHGELDGKGVRFLAVNVGEEPATVERYVAKTPFPYPSLLDPQDTMSARFRIMGLPTVMIVNRQGQITFLETGVSDANRLRRELAAAGATV